MAAARLAGDADEVGAGLQLLGVRLDPADRVVDVGERLRIGALGAAAPVERHHDDAMAGQHLVAHLVGQAVGQAPGAAVQVDQRRERPVAARLEHARQQRLVAVAEIFDVLHVEFVGPGIDGFGIHGGALAEAAVMSCAIFAQTAAPEQPARCDRRDAARALCFGGEMLSVRPTNQKAREERPCVRIKSSIAAVASPCSAARCRRSGAGAELADAGGEVHRAVRARRRRRHRRAAVRGEAQAKLGPAGGGREPARRRQPRRDQRVPRRQRRPHPAVRAVRQLHGASVHLQPSCPTIRRT